MFIELPFQFNLDFLSETMCVLKFLLKSIGNIQYKMTNDTKLLIYVRLKKHMTDIIGSLILDILLTVYHQGEKKLLFSSQKSAKS